ncbi:carboxylesterase family protein [Ottowia thiooxydans]|uniref:carboxylesterase family protein n=1 Tax=Ottowia thiooxydans TaxID=219182 RepID=UPI00146E2492|nr:carboxylesterase family protein [Ottowia thiooxydans]
METSLGRVQGVLEAGVETYRGIPYGEAIGPLGSFGAVSPLKAWGDILDCTQQPAVFPQPESRLASIMGRAVEAHVQSDQAFTLNISTPVGAKGLPVIVFLHGGGFTSGGAVRWYDGARLASKGEVVIVTMNYRLGAWGNIANPEVPRNNAILDVFTGLRWVSSNIAAFGGDSSNVTLAGQSAGAFLTLALAKSNEAKGLFKRVILMSYPGEIHSSLEEAQDSTNDLMRLLGARDIKDLASVSSEKIIEAVGTLSKGRAVAGSISPIFRPYVDETTLMAPVDEPASTHCSEMLIGFTREETAAFYWRASEDIKKDPESVVAWYQATHGESASHTYRLTASRRPRANPYTQWVDGISDELFVGPALRVADYVAGQACVYAYRFDLQTRQPSLYAPHCLDLPFFFDNLEQWSDAPMLEGFDIEELKPLAAHFSHAILSFAKRGVPDVEDWAPYQPAQPFLMAFDQI